MGLVQLSASDFLTDGKIRATLYFDIDLPPKDLPYEEVFDFLRNIIGQLTSSEKSNFVPGAFESDYHYAQHIIRDDLLSLLLQMQRPEPFDEFTTIIQGEPELYFRWLKRKAKQAAS